MKIKGILIDLDNTLYEYNSGHNIALDTTIQYISKMYSIPENTLRLSYESGRKQTHRSLHGLASSHSRLLYLQKLIEDNRISYKYILDFHNIYWDTFIKNMKLYEGVLELFTLFKDKNCIVTDLTADIQFKKLIQLGLMDNIKYIVTSEESGKEKPHPYIFHLALEKIGLDKTELVYIGDDYEKDIIGATSMGIKAIWLNRQMQKKELGPNMFEVNEFNQILEVIKKI
jgi:putative hydrolase of the HAD superfamily